MDCKQLALLKEIMEISFCLVETNLYLDTHPTDERALRIHNTFAKKYDELTNRYRMKYGPLMPTSMSKCPWQWIESPWPWEIDYSKCD
ncbi:spore coat protein CotJB [Thermohalobacter berrensis]|uniref:CotJB protein n=1 Tax=Thermohalobacter berrensis TaxID=99594 RepID=A0A419T9P0_9FIRM|nr:spore coat protein CotJB [Thermohalobacter berrensis]RKD34201.1 cotJB protein [Thermohalobacter berrensis]